MNIASPACRSLFRSLFTLIALILATPGLAFAQCKVALSEPDVAGQVTIDWCAKEASTPRRLSKRVDELTKVVVTSKNFNFLHFGLDYKVEDKVVDSYVTLEKLWSQIFQIGGLLAGVSDAAFTSPQETACEDFKKCAAKWLWQVQLTNGSLDEAIQSVGQAGPGLTEDQRNGVEKYSISVAAGRQTLLDARKKAMDEHPPSTVDEVDLFIRVESEHKKIMDKLSAFQVAARLIRNGQQKVIDKKKAGTIVTITISPKSRFEGVDGGKPATIEYFVHSKFGLVYHMGYAYSRLSDVDFEKVRALSGQDLFSQTKNQKDLNAFTAFLSFPLKSANEDDGKLGLYATLGTDMEKPGNRLYGSLSLRFARRVILNVGYGSSTIKEGKNKVLEQVGAGLATRELFDAIGTRRQWKPFIGLSVVVF